MPLIAYHSVLGQRGMYNRIFEPGHLLEEDETPHTSIPGQGGFRPWLIEAPLNSVELLEAMLQPSQPFEVFKTHHVPRRPISKQSYQKLYASEPGNVLDDYWLEKRHKSEQEGYADFLRRQGHLTRDGEISFICVPESAVAPLHDKLFTTFTFIDAHWISIPWNEGDGKITLRHPTALVLFYQPGPNRERRFTPYWVRDAKELRRLKQPPRVCPTYDEVLRRVMEEYGVGGSDFSRSLLAPGTVPLPETLLDWYFGRQGNEAALPYFAKSAEDNEEMVDEAETPDGNEAAQEAVGKSLSMPIIFGDW
ncbi:hypothetical protein B0I35DRAFT_474838 [Stachybotrys elegans]|uniref:Uncharacterized protein n=1 Tax=Stachybotrys elegans TaxID=80388 RepID=A0A8K0SY39_9HYPO|nr:hypothetical protein B0I35DRAFT_474838 [Stachybotrys elegans]